MPLSDGITRYFLNPNWHGNELAILDLDTKIIQTSFSPRRPCTSLQCPPSPANKQRVVNCIEPKRAHRKQRQRTDAQIKSFPPPATGDLNRELRRMDRTTMAYRVHSVGKQHGRICYDFERTESDLED